MDVAHASARFSVPRRDSSRRTGPDRSGIPSSGTLEACATAIAARDPCLTPSPPQVYGVGRTSRRIRMPALARPHRLLLGLCLMSGLVCGQTLSTIRGTATDATGAVVVGVRVSVREIRTNVKVRTVATDSNGNYEVPDLVTGLYEIRAEAAGFKTYVAENIVLEGAQIRRVDMTLQLGAIVEQVTVEAGAALITTDSAQISSGVKRAIYDQTPLVRIYYPQALLATLAGVESEASGFNLRINGQPTSQAALGMDGMTNDGTGNLINRLDFSEITVTGANNTADQAPAPNYNIISKRGTNQL